MSSNQTAFNDNLITNTQIVAATTVLTQAIITKASVFNGDIVPHQVTFWACNYGDSPEATGKIVAKQNILAGATISLSTLSGQVLSEGQTLQANCDSDANSALTAYVSIVTQA